MKSNCTYTFGGKSGITYQELLDNYYNLSEADREGITDYLYQKSKQEMITEMLRDLKYEYKGNVSADKDSYLTGEFTFSEVDNKKVFTLQSFIDSQYFRDEKGKILVPYLNRDNFIQYMIDKLEKDGIPRSQGKIQSEKMAKNWDKISEDAIIIHKLLKSDFDGLVSKLQEETKNTRLQDLDGQVLLDELEKIRKRAFYGKGEGCKIIRDLNLKAQIYGLDISVLGHIDNIIIDPNGELHIINYKVTTSVIDNEKQAKYKYQMALLKQMLSAAGFDTTHLTVEIIPIFVKYNDDYTKIKEVSVRKKLNLAYDSGDERKGKYTFQKYERQAEKFIKGKVIINEVDKASVDSSDKFLRAMFDERKITSKGIELSADEWIRRNKNNRIVRVYGNSKVKYKIIFSPNDVVEIEDHHSPENNEQIKREVQDRLLELDLGNHEMTAHNIVRLFQVAKQHKGFYSFTQEDGYERVAKFLDKIFKPYLQGQELHNGDFSPDWKIIESDVLLSRNIIALQNTHTGQIDIITISPHNLKETVKFRKVYNNILGNFLSDQSAIQKQIIKGSFGNIEMIRTMLLLNSVLPSLSGDIQLGQIQIISPENIGNEITYTFPQAVSQFSKIREIVQHENSDVFIENNFKNVKLIDSLEIFLKSVNNALDETRTLINERGANTLKDSSATREQRVQALKTIMRSMEQAYSFNSFDNLSVIESKSKELSDAVKLYRLVAKAVLDMENISDEIDYNEDDISSLESDFQSATNIGSNNIRLIGGMFFQTVNHIAERSFQDTRPVQQYLTQFYKGAGYGNLQNETLGNQEVAFKNLFQEIDGKRIMKFRNPYTDSTLKPHEREFLKKVLFTLATVRQKMFPTKVKFQFKDYNDEKLKQFAENTPWYLDVPLMRASKATKRFTKQGFSEWALRMKRIFTLDGGKNITEFMEGLSNESEVARMNEAMSTLTVDNRYGWYEAAGGNENSRFEYLEQHPVEYFETNVETILMNFITAQNEVEELDDFMLKTRAILLVLNSIGDEFRFKNTLDYIKKYLKINVYNKHVVEDTSKKLISMIEPARHLATSVYILGNLSSGVRDLTEGLLQNFTRSVTKFQTNISAKNLSKAYLYVTKHSITSARSISLLNQLNIKYRLSNVDIARIQEVLATNRGGIKNYDTWLYATLRKPDFINRMSLFVARCMQDGVWNALSVDENGNFKYDWTLDERFSYYAKNRKNPPENDAKFLEQKGRYLSAILEYNKENPNNALNIQDPDVALPNPYTHAEIEGIKTVSDSIYGSYDKSKKAMYEFQTKGVVLGQFTTWMNGMVGNYFRKPGTKTGEMKLVQSTTDTGELEFLDEYSNVVVEKIREDGTKYYINEENGEEVKGNVVPLFKNIPVISQGIIYSVIDLVNKTIPYGFEQNGISGVIDELKKIWFSEEYEQEKKNLTKLFSDILMWVVLASLYQYAISPAYEDLKKKRDKEDLLLNSIEDILYKGTSSSYDGFRGPWNVIDSFGNNMNPPAYKVTTKIITDIGKTAIGQKTVGQLLTQNVPVLRSFRNAYDAYVK